MEDTNWRILLVDDDPDDYVLTRALLEEAERRPFTLQWAADLEAGWRALQEDQFDAVLVDYDLGARNGVELVQRAASRGYPAPLILLTGHGSYDLDLQAMHAGADDYLNKAEVTPLLLEHTIRYAVERKQSKTLLNERNQQLAASAAELAAANQGLQAARAELEQRVQERTRALQQANAHLERINAELEEANSQLEARSADLLAANLELENEIQERLRVETDLREHAARLNLILEEIPAVLWSTDTELRFVSSGGKGLEPLGLKPGQRTGRLLAEFTETMANGQESLAAHRRALAGEHVSFAGLVGGRTFRSHVAPLHNLAGEITGCIGVGLDVTETIQAEQAYRESQQRLNTVIESAPVMLWSVDQNLDLTLLEGQATTRLGIDPENLVGRSLKDRLAQRPDLLACLERARAGEQVRSVAPSLFNPQEMMETHYAPYLAENGAILGVIGVSILVTERVQAQARLAYQARLLENVTDAIVAYDHNFRLTAWNRAAEELYGWSAPQALGRTVAEVLQEDYGPATAQDAQRRLRETGRFNAELIHHRRDGQPVYVETRTITLRDESGETSGYVAVNRDISERKQAEAELKESQALFASLFDSAPDTMLLIDLQGRILRANRRALDNFGYSKVELSGRPLEALLPEELRATYRELRDSHFQNSQLDPVPLDLELSGLRKDGSQFPIDITLSPLRWDGQQQMICVIRDVTRRKLAEAALRDSEARFRTVFEESALGIALKDLDGRILASNPALQELLGYTAAELCNRRFDELTHPQDVPAEIALFEQLASGGLNRYELEKRYVHKDGHPLWACLAVSLVRDAAEQPQFAVFLVENIHERKRMETELSEVRRRLMDNREEERMELARDLHDGPMQELYGVMYQLGELQAELALAAEPGPPPAGGGAGEAAIESVPAQLESLRAHVLGTIQELRGFCGALRPPMLTPFGLEATLRAHAETFQEEHPEIELQLDLQPDGLTLPERVRVALFRIYQQSLANVARHAGARQVLVRFAFDAEQVQLEIEDNGQGFEVPPRWIDFVRQGHLGLAGAAERAEALGGKLQVSSAPGGGTRLRVTAPWREA